MSEPSSSSRPADDTAEGEAAREYEEAWGHNGTRRGIWSGRIAKRKRDAYIRHISEQQCVDPLDVPVIHQGGQSRPLFTPATWEPESSKEDEPDRTEYTQDPLTHPSRPLSQATSEVTRLVPRPKTPPKSPPVPKTPPKSSPVPETLPKSPPLTVCAVSSQAVSSSKGSAKPKFARDGLLSKGSVPASSVKGSLRSTRSDFPGKGNFFAGISCGIFFF